MFNVLEREEVDLVIPSQEEIEAELSKSTEAHVFDIVSKIGYLSPSANDKFRKLNKLKEVSGKSSVVSLAQVFKEIGVKPFTAKSVKKHKKRMILFGNLKTIPFYAFSSSLILCIAISIFLYNYPSDLLLLASFIVSLVPIVLASGGIWVIETKTDNKYRWVIRNIRSYGKEIPFYVLERIAEINTRCPNASFWIDELRNNPDPFLIVRLEETGEEYYIEVWNEPNYKQERMK